MTGFFKRTMNVKLEWNGDGTTSTPSAKTLISCLKCFCFFLLNKTILNHLRINRCWKVKDFFWKNRLSQIIEKCIIQQEIAITKKRREWQFSVAQWWVSHCSITVPHWFSRKKTAILSRMAVTIFWVELSPNIVRF